MTAPEPSLWDTIDGIREQDRRYAREAYLFVVAALGAVVRRLPPERVHHPERRHLSGRELLGGVIDLARAEFGSLSAAVFEEWGVRHGEDVGNIVFQLVESGQLSARPEDSIEDFRGGPDLLRALADQGRRSGENRPGRRAGSGRSPEP
jgi:uncharacterized repeat protein (TIGR04138 family)